MRREFSRLLAGAGFAITLAVAAGSAYAGTLTNASVTLSNAAPSSATTVTLRYTTETLLDGSTGNNNLLIATFPGLTLTNDLLLAACPSSITVTANSIDISNGFNICATYGTDSIQLRLAPGQTVAAGSQIVVTIDSTRVATSSTAATYTASAFRTSTNGGATIDSPSPLPSYTIEVPAPVPTLSEWAMMLFGTILAGGAALVIQRRRQFS